MFMNFKFSHGYGEYQPVQSVGVCCYSNTHSAEVLLEQQWATSRSMGPHARRHTGGL